MTPTARQRRVRPCTPADYANGKMRERMTATKTLRRRSGGPKIAGLLPTKASRMGRKRTHNPDPKTPAGQLAIYLQYLIGDDAQKIADKTGLSRATIFNYMALTSSPTIDALNKIAKALGKSDYRDMIPPPAFVDGLIDAGRKGRKR